MKILTRAFVIFALIMASSCEKEKNTEEEPTVENNENTGSGNGSGSGNNSTSLSSIIVGSWEMTDFEQQNGVISTMGNQAATFTASGSDFKGELQFLSNGTTVSNLGYKYTLNITYTGMPPMPQTQTLPQTQITGSYQVISNNKISTNAMDGKTAEMTVSDLTSTSMTITYAINESTTQNGITSTTTCDAMFKLKKK